MANRLIEAIAGHIEKHIGEPADVLHELIPADVHVDLHIVLPTEKRPFYTVVTSGMSEHAMAIPEELEGQVTPHVELMLCLPKDWKISALEDPRWNWPMKWLWCLAKYPHDFNTWLYVSHTIPNSEECDPFGPGTKQCCWFVRLPQTVTEAGCEMEYEGRTILFLALTAIYREEMEFALSAEPDSLYALDQALTAAGVTEVVDPKRTPLSLEAMRGQLGKMP